MNDKLINFIYQYLESQEISKDDLDPVRLQGDGSIRSFYRIGYSGIQSTFIAMENIPSNELQKKENMAYLMIGKHLKQQRIPVPDMLYWDLEHGFFLMEDLGDTNLQDITLSAEDPLPLYEKVLLELIRLQIEGAKGFDLSWCCQTSVYDRSVMGQYESEYFRNACLKNYFGIGNEWPGLQESFDHLSGNASKADNRFFLHRDFQSRNIMVRNGDIAIIDWQSGRQGPLGYDLASLIIDPYVTLSTIQKEHLFKTYVLMLEEYNADLTESVKNYFPYLAVQRNLQILGAFSYLGKVKGKKYFEQYIPPALESLNDLLCQINDKELLSLKNLSQELLAVL